MPVGTRVFAHVMACAPWHTVSRLIATSRGEFPLRTFSGLPSFCAGHSRRGPTGSVCARGPMPTSRATDASTVSRPRPSSDARALSAKEPLGVEWHDTVYARDAPQRRVPGAGSVGVVPPQSPSYGTPCSTCSFPSRAPVRGGAAASSTSSGGLAGIRLAVSSSPAPRPPYVHPSVLPPGRSPHRRALRSGRRVDGVRLPATRSRTVTLQTRSRCRGPTPGGPVPSSAAARIDGVRAVSPARAGRTVLPIDTPPLHSTRFFGTSTHAVNTHVWIAVSVSARGASIRTRRDLERSVHPRLQILSVPHSRTCRHVTCVPTPTHPPIRWSTVISGCCDDFCRPLVGAIKELYLRIEHPDVRWKHGGAALWNRPLIDPLS